MSLLNARSRGAAADDHGGGRFCQTATTMTAGLFSRSSRPENSAGERDPTPTTYHSIPPGTSDISNGKSQLIRLPSITIAPAPRCPAPSVCPSRSATRTTPPAWMSAADGGAVQVEAPERGGRSG